MDKQKIEKQLKFIDDYTLASNAAEGSKYDSNANVTSKNISTIQCELGKKDLIHLNRAIIEKYLKDDNLIRMFREDLDKHRIYSHDESSIMPYCASISMYPFLLRGLEDLGGTSGAPKHTKSFVGGSINLLFLIASQFAGAVAMPEWLTYLDHFLRKDFGQDYINHLWENENKNLCIGHIIEDYFQQFVYSINQPAGARNYQSPFTNIAYFDKYYFESIFKNFVFPDLDKPCWETTKELQKMFMRWFNKERERKVLTFPVETFNILTENGKCKDEETFDFMCEMLAAGHSFFCYQSDSVDALASCCRLRNSVKSNVFSYTLGAGGIKTGSKKVITINLNRVVQDWYNENNKASNSPCDEISLSDYIAIITSRVQKYLSAYNDYLYDMFDRDILPAYKAGYIDLEKQYLTIGVNGLVEAAEFLKSKGYDIEIKSNNKGYKKLAKDTLGTIKKCNQKSYTDKTMYNLEMVPGENASAKLYMWDKKDGYVVPTSRNLYNSYFYVVEDSTISPIEKLKIHGNGFASECDGGVACHINLSEFLTKEQYKKMMLVAIKSGCNYFTYNVPSTCCEDCGHINKHYTDHCIKCGSKNITYATRIIGYLKKVSNFSEARKLEASRRYYASGDTINE